MNLHNAAKFEDCLVRISEHYGYDNQVFENYLKRSMNSRKPLLFISISRAVNTGSILLKRRRTFTS